MRDIPHTSWKAASWQVIKSKHILQCQGRCPLRRHTWDASHHMDDVHDMHPWSEGQCRRSICVDCQTRGRYAIHSVDHGSSP